VAFLIISIRLIPFLAMSVCQPRLTYWPFLMAVKVCFASGETLFGLGATEAFLALLADFTCGSFEQEAIMATPASMAAIMMSSVFGVFMVCLFC